MYYVPVPSLNLERFRLLSGVRMFVSSEDMKLLEHLSTQRILGKHAFHCELDRPLRMLIEQLLQAGRFEVTQVTRVVVIELVRQLPTGHVDLAGVEDDDVVAGVAVRRVSSFVLTA